VWIDTVARECVGGIDLPILLQIDAVVNHMYARGIHIKQSFDVAFGLARNRDDRVRHLQRGFLNPKREVVTTGELFALPGSKRFERVNRDHERNSVILFRQYPAEMAVPRVTMHKIGVDVRSVEVRASPHRPENGAQWLRASEIARVDFVAGDLEIAFFN